MEKSKGKNYGLLVHFEVQKGERREVCDFPEQEREEKRHDKGDGGLTGCQEFCGRLWTIRWQWWLAGDQ